MKALRINRQPTARLEIENVSVVNVAMKDGDVAQIGKQGVGNRPAIGQRAAVFFCCRFQVAEPAGEGYWIGKWLLARRMQPCCRPAEDTACLVVFAIHRHGKQRAFTRRPFQKHGVALMSVDMGGTVAVPPLHQQRAISFVFVGRHLQHGGPIPPADWQQAARMGEDRLAVGYERPAIEIRSEHWDTVQRCSGNGNPASRRDLQFASCRLRRLFREWDSRDSPWRCRRRRSTGPAC